jgi:small subunit ribosomal protein S15
MFLKSFIYSSARFKSTGFFNSIPSSSYLVNHCVATRSFIFSNQILRKKKNDDLLKSIIDSNKEGASAENAPVKQTPDDSLSEFVSAVQDKKSRSKSEDSDEPELDEGAEMVGSTELMEFLTNPKGAFDDYINEERKQEVLDIPQLFPIYPKRIKKWIIYTKSPTGIYNKKGEWEAEEEEEESDDFKEQVMDCFTDGTDAEPAAPAEETQSSEGSYDEPKKLDLKSDEFYEKVFEKEQSELPPDLRGRFRYGVTFDQIKDYHPKLRRLFSMSLATPSEQLQVRKHNAIIKWGRHPTDTASDAVQVDILTQRIRALEEHLKHNKQDQMNKRALQKMIRRRKVMMIRLKKRDSHTYFSVLREIKLKDLYHVWDMRVH